MIPFPGYPEIVSCLIDRNEDCQKYVDPVHSGCAITASEILRFDMPLRKLT